MKILETYKALNDYEREDILEKMTKPQQDYVQNGLKNGKKTIFANDILRLNMDVNNSENIDLTPDEYNVADWELVRYVDYGRGNAMGRCYCKRPIVLECIIRNNKTGRELTMGRSHLAMFYGIGRSVFNKYFEKYLNIDYERDEILMKFRDNAFTTLLQLSNAMSSDVVKSRITIPDDIQQHIDLGLPLLAKQEQRMRTAFKKKKLRDPFDTILDDTELATVQQEDEHWVIPERLLESEEVQSALELGLSHAEIRKMIELNPPEIRYVKNGSFLDMYEKELDMSEEDLLSLPTVATQAEQDALHRPRKQEPEPPPPTIHDKRWIEAEKHLNEYERFLLNEQTAHVLTLEDLDILAFALIKANTVRLTNICDALATRLTDRIPTGFYQTRKRKVYYNVIEALRPRVLSGQLIETKIGVFDVIYRINENYQEPIDTTPKTLFDI